MSYHLDCSARLITQITGSLHQVKAKIAKRFLLYSQKLYTVLSAGSIRASGIIAAQDIARRNRLYKPLVREHGREASCLCHPRPEPHSAARVRTTKWPARRSLDADSEASGTLSWTQRLSLLNSLKTLRPLSSSYMHRAGFSCCGER